jgi:hypothetical protein
MDFRLSITSRWISALSRSFVVEFRIVSVISVFKVRKNLDLYGFSEHGCASAKECALRAYDASRDTTGGISMLEYSLANLNLKQRSRQQGASISLIETQRILTWLHWRANRAEAAAEANERGSLLYEVREMIMSSTTTSDIT